MKINYNFVNFEDDLPLTITLLKVNGHESLWHPSFKLLYSLEGNSILSINEDSYEFNTDNFILINPWTFYEIKAENEVAFLDIEFDFVKAGFTSQEIDNLSFMLNSIIDNDMNKYSVIKASIFALIKLNTKPNKYISFINKSLSYQIIYLLLDQFRVEKKSRIISQKYLLTLKDILNYINNNYKNDISLNEISEEFGYTPQYFSFFFKKHMNQTFQSYYDMIRINKTLHLINNSDMSLEDIAQETGFNDYRGYIRAFKSIYGITPSELRKKKKNESIEDPTTISLNTNHYLDIIYNYKMGRLDSIIPKPEKIIELNINFNDKGKEIKKTFQNMIGVGRASDLLRENIRTMLLQAQEEIGFKYLKFQGIFNDDMHVYRVFRNGEKSYSFVFIDQVFDYLKSINLKPFIQLSYMPRDMAKNKDKIVFESKYIASAPNDINEWCNLVEAFIYHEINKYSYEEVITWPIAIWNEPDSSIHAFGFLDDEEFYEFYRRTYETIKGISKKFQVGTPNLIPFASWAIDWDRKFLKYTEQNGCYPDFLNVTYYSNDFDFFITGKSIEKLNKNPNNLSDYIDKIKDPKFYHGTKVYLTEWGLTSNHRNLLNDTIFSSCYLTKNICENMDRLECFSKWCLTDFLDQTQLPHQTYHGGPGLFTYNGICKAPYQALKLIAQLDNTVIASGEGYYVTKSNEYINIIIYNYTHYSDLYADGEYFSISKHSRYEPFKMDYVNKFNFHFDNIPFSYAKIKVSRITRESGSSYDIYENISKIDFENTQETSELKKLSTAKYVLYDKDIIDNKFNLEEELNPLEVKLIKIRLYKKKIIFN